MSVTWNLYIQGIQLSFSLLSRHVAAAGSQNCRVILFTLSVSVRKALAFLCSKRMVQLKVTAVSYYHIHCWPGVFSIDHFNLVNHFLSAKRQSYEIKKIKKKPKRVHRFIVSDESTVQTN